VIEPPWAADDPWPRFSAAEIGRRWEAMAGLLREVGSSVCLVAGHGGGRAELQFLSNVPVRWESLLLVPAEGGVDAGRLLVQLDNHAAGSAGWSVCPVEATGSDLAGRAAALALALAVGGPVALLGPVSDRLAAGLRGRLAGRELVSIDAAFRRLRMVKSAEELAWTRYGAALCDLAFDRFLAEARPGPREDELGALLSDAVMRLGGQVGICFLATASMTDGGASVPNQVWSRRPTSGDDLAMFELSAGMGGVTGQLLRSVSLGAEPSPIVRELHALAESVFERLFQVIRPGLPVAALEEIGGDIDAAGCTIVDDLVHGYGGGYLPPHVRTPAARREPPDGVLEAGMLLVIQPNVVTADGRFGVQTGELVEVTESGARSMHTAPRGLATIQQAGGST
jgi:Xaa-Pro aminopeptidase